LWGFESLEYEDVQSLTQSNQSKEASVSEPAHSSNNITNLHWVSLNFVCQVRIVLPSDALICASSMKTWNIPESCQKVIKIGSSMKDMKTTRSKFQGDSVTVINYWFTVLSLEPWSTSTSSTWLHRSNNFIPYTKLTIPYGDWDFVHWHYKRERETENNEGKMGWYQFPYILLRLYLLVVPYHFPFTIVIGYYTFSYFIR